MLQIFENYTPLTRIYDDFQIYDDQEKAREERKRTKARAEGMKPYDRGDLDKNEKSQHYRPHPNPPPHPQNNLGEKLDAHVKRLSKDKAFYDDKRGPKLHENSKKVQKWHNQGHY